MIIIETRMFTRQITELLDDDAYRELQNALAKNPTAGAVIPGTGGLRKLRWRVPGRGKSGGIRVIYYRLTQDRLYLLLAYSKTDQEDLTPEQCRVLKQLIESETDDDK